MQNYTELQIADDSAAVNKSGIFSNRLTTVCLRKIQKNHSSKRKGESVAAVIFYGNAVVSGNLLRQICLSHRIADLKDERRRNRKLVNAHA